MSRREFKKSVRVEIIKRATREIGNGLSEQYCEECHQPTKGRFEVHHLREDALEVDKSKPLTAEDGALWCKPCHDEHTTKFSTPAAAKAKRKEAAHLGAKPPPANPIQSAGFRKTEKSTRVSTKPSLPPRAMFK